MGEKAKTIDEQGQKLWYTGRDRNMNGIGIVLDLQLVDEVVDVSGRMIGFYSLNSYQVMRH